MELNNKDYSPWKNIQQAFNGDDQEISSLMNNTNGTSSLTENSYTTSGTLSGSVSINNYSTGAFSTDSAGDNVVALDSSGDKLVLSPGLQGSINNAQGQQIASYTSGVLGYVGKDASGEAVIGTVQLSVYSGQLLNLSLLNTDGTLTADGISFNSSDNLYTSSFSQLTSNPYSLQTAANNAIGLDAAGAAITNTYIPTLVVVQTGAYNSSLASAETSNNVAGGEVLGGGDFAVVDPYVNLNGVFNNSPAGVLSGNYQPGQESLLPPEQDVAALLGPAAAGVDPTPVAAASYGVSNDNYPMRVRKRA